MATTALLWQVLAVAVAFANAQSDLPYPLQLVPGVPSAVSAQLYGPEPKAVSLIRGTTTTNTKGADGQHQAPAEEEMTQFHSQDALGRSLFGYMMADQARIEARAPDGSVRGSYSYLDPSGRAIKVQYWDEGQGFHAAGNHLPATYPGLPQPVRDTPEVEAARRQHLDAYQQVLRRQLELLYQQQVQDHHQQQQQQGYQPPPDGSEEVVVESDPAAPPADYAEDEPGHRYPSLPLVPALYDPSHVHDVGRDAVIVDSAAGRQGQQGSTMDDRQDSGDSSKMSVDNGDVLGHEADSGQRFVIVYADSATGDNTIGENDDEKPSAKHVRSAHQNSSTSDVAGPQNHTKTDTRKAKRGRITIYDYIKERDPERMARDFPESYLIQEIFNSTSSRTNTEDDTDNLQRAAEREFQFLHKIGGARSRGRSMLAADVVTSDSGSRRRTFYKAGMVLPDLSYPTRHSGETKMSGSKSGTAYHGGEPVLHGGYASYNGNRGTYRPHFTYDENGASDTPRQGSPSHRHRSDSHPLVSTEGDINHNYSVASVNSVSQDTPHPVYYPQRTNSYLNQSQMDGHEVYDESGRSNIHRDQSSLQGTSPVTLPQEGNLGAYDMRDMQDPYYHQELPLDTYFRPQEHSRSRYEPHPVYYQGSIYPDVNETQVTSDSSFNGTDSDVEGGQYQLFYDSSVASSHLGTQVASRGRSNERSQSRNLSPEGRMSADVVYGPPHSKYGALFVKVDSDDGSRDHRGVSRVSSQIVAQPHVSGGYYSTGNSAYRDHQDGHPSGVTNVGGYPPVAMQYLQDIARRADTPTYMHAGTKEAVVLNNLIGRSASSKARSLEVAAAAVGEGGNVADPESRTGASKEELVAGAVAAGSPKDEHVMAGVSEAGRSAPVDQRSVVSLKDGPAESYSAMYIYPDRQAKAASPKASAMPQPQVDGGFFYSFHHPVIPVGVQVAQPLAADAPDAATDADAKAPPRGLSVSQRASLYDAVPVAAVHDAQVPPYLRGAVTDHQTKPVFIHYDPAEAGRAS